MNQKELKTSLAQRIVIIFIAILMLGSTIAVYISIVLSGNKSAETTSETDKQLAELQSQYQAKQEELKNASQTLSDKYFSEFSQYTSRVRAYNATTANTSGLQRADLKEGTGATLEEGTNYLAYYIGWCADESVFDSSLDSIESPTLLGAPIPGGNLIEGWTQGVIGMKLGGVRELTIPGELAYGETREICGATGSPLKFVVMAIPPDPTVTQLWQDIDNISTQIQMLSYGISL